MFIKERFLNNHLFSRALPIVLSVWIISLTAYYLFNTPWLSFFSSGRPDTEQIIADALKFHWVPVFLSRLLYVLYAFILNFIALLIGNRILRWLKVDFDSNLNRIIFPIPLGWSIYSIGIFYLGVSGLLYVEAVYLFLTLLGILSIFEIKRFFKPSHPNPLTRGERIGEGRFKLDKTDLVFLPVIIIFIAIQIVVSFSPVWAPDALMYHMGLPKLYIKHHAIVHIPGFFFSTLPAHTDMLYLFGLITSGETLSKLFSFGISTMFLITIFSIGNRYFSRGTGYLAVIIMILSVTTFSCYFSEPCVDVAFALFLLLGVYAFFMWIEGRKEGYLYLSIICCALAAATKMQGLFFVPLFFVGFLFTVKPIMNSKSLGKLAWCSLAVCVIALPWYVRNWWLTGDPVFPFLYYYLGADAEYWNKYISKYFWAFLSHPTLRGPKSFSDFIRINKDLFFSTRIVENLQGNAKIFVFIFFVPALITLLITPRNWNRPIRYLFLVTLIYYIFFIFTSPQGRFFYMGYAILSIILAHFINTVWTKHLLTRISTTLCIVVFSVISFSASIAWIEGSFFAGLGILDQKRFYADNYYNKASVWVNENLPQDSKILHWWAHGYHLDRAYMWANPILQSVLDFDRIKDTSTFLKSIKELGITHLIYESNDSFPKRPKEFLDKCVFELLESGKITLIKQIDSCSIYLVNK